MMSTITRSSSNSPNILLHSAVDPNLFPLRSIGDVINFFRRSLENYAQHGVEPDLTLLSIIAGYIEIALTTRAQTAAVSAAEQQQHQQQQQQQQQHHHHNVQATTIASNIMGAGGATTTNDIIIGNSVPFPVITHDLIAGLYKKFQSILSVVEKPKTTHGRQATREIIKKVSDVIWHSLIRSSHKDRAHLQNLYSYLSGNKLDCFGVALAVVAGCQMLGYRDVHLAISEDHAWVVFGGSKRRETIEVTWHGKGSEDKRGQSILHGIESGSWLYLGGLAVECDRIMEVAAIASAINISLTSNSDCVEVADMQQKLLWLLYDLGHLKKYPMALGTLGELEEINPTHKNITCEQLYREAIQSAQNHYKNHHVYPYTYLGHHYNRLYKHREAFAAWANAADVIRLYTYSCRDDEEIYKELLDIANEMIPYVMKMESSGHSARSILRDSEVFANLLRFYDGICQWEEDSLTPVIHIGWAKPLVNNIAKFDYDIRSQVVIKVPEDEFKTFDKTKSENNGLKKDENNEAMKKDTNDILEGNNNNNNNNNDLIKKEEKSTNDVKQNDKEIPTTLADLTAACGEKILNPDFLLQGGNKPFAEQKLQEQQDHDQEQKQETKELKPEEEDEKNKPEANGKSDGHAEDKTIQTENKEEKSSSIEEVSIVMPQQKTIIEDDPFEFMLKKPVITLYSQKMKGLKDLLLAEKLNTHAILLQVTAQSVASKKIRGIDKMGNPTTNSMYATVNMTAAAAAATHHHHHHHHNKNVAESEKSHVAAAAANAPGAQANDSIATSRPKRARRE